MKTTTLIPITIAILITLAAHASAITITPAIIDAKDLERASTYEYTSYIINNDPETKTIQLDITPRSEYLKPYVSITPQSLTIPSGKKETINIILTIPQDPAALSNGSHTITIIPDIDTADSTGVKLITTSIIELRFNIPGIVKDILQLDTFTAPDTEEKETIPFTLKAKNTGSIRQRAIPYIDIYHYGKIIDTIHGTTQYTIDPDQSRDMLINYPSTSLKPGKYKAIAYLIYSTGKKSNTIEETFKVSSTPPNEDNPAPQQDAQDSSPPSAQDTIGTTEEKENIISIGAPDDTSSIKDDQKKTTTESIIIKEFSAQQKGNTAQITLLIENKESYDIDYDLVISIYDIAEKKVATIIASAIIASHSSSKIEKTWTPKNYGNYTIIAKIEYMDKDTIKKIHSKTAIKIIPPKDNLTGLLLGTYSTPKLALTILVIIILLIFVIKMKKKQQELIESASKRYMSAEDNLKKIAKKTGDLKTRIRKLKVQTNDKETKK